VTVPEQRLRAPEPSAPVTRRTSAAATSGGGRAARSRVGCVAGVAIEGRLAIEQLVPIDQS
jgi:hypothetical protein